MQTKLNKHRVVVSTKVKPETAEWLYQKAFQTRKTRSTLIREMLERVEQHHKRLRKEVGVK